MEANNLIGYLEDDPVIRENYIDLLESDGFKVVAYEDKDDALEGFAQNDIALALLDVELANDRLGGLEVCKVLRTQKPDIPIIFLTSHSHIDIQSRGWRLGADDYVTKETEVELVLLRVRALLKRYNVLKERFAQSAEEINDVNSLVIDDCGMKVYWKSCLLDLSLTQFWLLKALYSAGGKAVSHEDLQKAASIVVEPNTIVAHIKAIRDEFKKCDATFEGIKTERGKGYRWAYE